MILLMAIALIAIGPKQLPEMARTLGKLLNELRKISGDFTSSLTQVREEANRFTRETEAQVNEALEVVNPAHKYIEPAEETSEVKSAEKISESEIKPKKESSS